MMHYGFYYEARHSVCCFDRSFLTLGARFNTYVRSDKANWHIVGNHGSGEPAAYIYKIHIGLHVIRR
jgi:hypothetical protein